MKFVFRVVIVMILLMIGIITFENIPIVSESEMVYEIIVGEDIKDEIEIVSYFKKYRKIFRDDIVLGYVIVAGDRFEIVETKSKETKNNYRGALSEIFYNSIESENRLLNIFQYSTEEKLGSVLCEGYIEVTEDLLIRSGTTSGIEEEYIGSYFKQKD